MINIFFVVTALFLLYGTRPAYSSSFAVPSLGAVVHNADVIVSGSFSVDGTTVVFHVESNVKGKYRPSQSLRIIGSSDDIFFDLSRYAAQLHGQQCFVLGADRDGVIFLPWNSFSVWPQGISQQWPVFGDVNTCAEFIAVLLEYERLAQTDESNLVRNIMTSLQVDSSRPATLAYLDSNPSIFQKSKSLERDILSVVAAQISASRVYDDWTSSCMLSLSPSMPPSITIPYFMDISKREGVQGELAQSAVEATLKVRNLLDPNMRDREGLSAAVSAVLPSLRSADAKRNAHLFDATNSDIAAAAPLVFSEVFGEPRPSGKSASEEKTFWTGKISAQPK